MMLALAVFLVLVGVAALRLAWHFGRNGRPRRRLALRWVGWLTLVVSLAPWTAATGDDRGVALAIVAVMLAGLVLVLREGRGEWQTSARRRREREARQVTAPAGRGLLARRLWIFCLAGPIALAGSLALGLAMWLFLARAGMQAANVLAVSMLTVPVIWALLAVIATMDAGLWRRTLLVIVPGALAAATGAVLVGGAA